jgi:chromosome segregation ATPase
VGELIKSLGGVLGLMNIVGLLAVGYYARFRVPQAGVEMLRRELELNRAEVLQADRDRQALRQEMREARGKIAGLEAEYMRSLTEKERLRRHCRNLERLLREAKIAFPSFEGERES